MTDQLEHDLRTMLADRATSVTADPAANEQRIAERLRAGDDAVAAVVPLLARPPRRRWPAVAAAAAALVVGAAIAINLDDSDVRTGPSEAPPTPVEVVPFYTGNGTAEDVATAYLTDRLDVEASTLALETLPRDTETVGYSWVRTDTPAASGGYVFLDGRDEVWGVNTARSEGASIETAERDADSVTVTTTAPAGSFVQLSVHRLTGEAITAGGCGGETVGAGGVVEDSGEPVGCDLVDEPIDVGDDPLTARFSVVTQEGVRLTLEEQLLEEPEGTDPESASEDDPMLGGEGDTAKDVAERVALTVFGDEYVTTDVEPARDSYLVTMEGPDGSSVAADVMGLRVLSIVSPELAHLLSDGLEVRDGVATVAVPMPGTLTLVGLDDSLSPLGSTPHSVVDGNTTTVITDVEPWLTDAVWVWLSVETTDGQVLQAFGAAP